MYRSIASHLVVLVIGMAAGLGAVAVAQNQSVPRGSAASDRAIVRELKGINSKLGYNFRKNSLVGLTFDGFSDLHSFLVETCNALNRSISGSSIGCPDFTRGAKAGG